MSAETVTPSGGGQPTSDPASSSESTGSEQTNAGGGATTPDQSTVSEGGAAQAEQPTGTSSPSDEEAGLISDADFEALQDDPAELRRRLNAAYTQRRQQEAPARRLWKAIQENPDFVLEQLATARGRKLTAAEAAAAGEAPDPESVLLTALSDAIGEDAAKKFLPAVQEMVQTAVKPYKDEAERQRNAAERVAAQEVETAFTQKYPDWKKHEKNMMALAQYLQPKGLNPFQYMEVLLSVVDKEGNAARAVGEHAQRQSLAARAIADARVTGESTPPVSTNDVQKGPMTIRQAIMASMDEIEKKRK